MRGIRLFKKIIVFLLITIIVSAVVFPLYIMLKIALSPPQEIFQPRPPYLIHKPTGGHFRNVVASGQVFLDPLKKSLLTALAVTFVSLLIATPAAYAIARFDYRLRYLFLLIIFVSRMIPEITIALPVSVSFIKMGLFDTVPGLVLAHLIRVLPIACFILTGVFAGFPRDLEEQAYVDGCTRLQAIGKIVLPLTMTGISVAAVFSFLFSWDEFIYASYLCLAHPTMPLKVYYYLARGDIFYSATYAVIITLPVLLLTLLLQKYLKPEYLSGAIKG